MLLNVIRNRIEGEDIQRKNQEFLYLVSDASGYSSMWNERYTNMGFKDEFLIRDSH